MSARKAKTAAKPMGVKPAAGKLKSAGGERAAMKISPPLPEPRSAEFEELYQRHSREIWALAYARWMNADVALDIVQEAYLRLWRQWQDGGGNEIVNPRAWLLRVARNLAEDFAKS